MAEAMLFHLQKLVRAVYVCTTLNRPFLWLCRVCDSCISAVHQKLRCHQKHLED